MTLRFPPVLRRYSNPPYHLYPLNHVRAFSLPPSGMIPRLLAPEQSKAKRTSSVPVTVTTTPVELGAVTLPSAARLIP